MGFLDNVTSAVNRGTAAAGRSADKIKLNARIGELNKQRQNLAAQLGASLYEATRNDPAFTNGREPLYEGIAQIDAEREECQLQIQAIDEQAAASAAASTFITCNVCGAQMRATDLFCSGCGSSNGAAGASNQATYSGPTCVACGAPMQEGDVFCMKCGAKVEAPTGIAVETEVVEVTETGKGE